MIHFRSQFTIVLRNKTSLSALIPPRLAFMTVMPAFIPTARGLTPVMQKSMPMAWGLITTISA